MLAVWALGALGCMLGALDPPTTASHSAVGRQAVDLLRVVATASLSVTILLGPGILWRGFSARRIRLAYMPLPGFGLLVLTAALAWLLASGLSAETTCLIVLGPLMALLYVGLLAAKPDDLFSSEERRVLILTSLPLGLAIARSLWSPGPAGELWDLSVSRTLASEPRPDSIISYLVSELVSTGTHPYSKAGAGLFFPYNFSSRGPLPGMATAPIMLVSGTHAGIAAPPLNFWEPFDAQGVMAYRIAMITFSCTVFLSLWELVRRIGGSAAARWAVLLGVSTPFLVDDLLFTWPKLLAASMVLLGADCLVARLPLRSGLLVATGYLMHPSALLSLVGLGPIALWPITGASWRKPRVLAAVWLIIGTGIGVEMWRLVNGPDFQQSGFLEYTVQAYPHLHPSVQQWLDFRVMSLGDTVVPLFLPIFEGHSWFLNVFGGRSPGVVHFFYQYWTGVPFGFGIFFCPLLLLSLWRAARRWPWPILATIVFPFVAFSVYWGASITGLLRENLQAWVLAVIAVVALEQGARRFSWRGCTPVRVILCLRAVEVLAAATGATVGTRGGAIFKTAFPFTDIAAVTAMLAFTGLVVRAVWLETAPGHPDAAQCRDDRVRCR